MPISIGLDIGGTKCAISTGKCTEDSIDILSREEFPTAGLSWQQVLEEFASRIETISKDSSIEAIGISCGGPLDSQKGLILSPPNLPGWDNVPIVKFFADRFGVPVHVQNVSGLAAERETWCS